MSPLYLQNGKLLQKNGKLAISANCCCNECEICSAGSITISLCIDGSDFFILQGCLLTSEHRNWQPPGPCTGCETAAVNGVEWPFPIDSNPFNLEVLDKKFGKASSISVVKNNGRGEVTVVQQPGPDNNWTGKVLIDDDNPAIFPGTDCYEIEISWTC